MKPRKYDYMVGDFETTVYDEQTETEVWASAIVPMYSEDVKIFHSIADTYEYLVSLKKNLCVYYHNLKFDGSFWLSYLMVDLKLIHAYNNTNPETYEGFFLDDDDMPNGSFKYSISDMGQWYSVKIKKNNKIIELRDSYKLLPFSVADIGKSFNTKHRKLDMEYKGLRYAGCKITEDEQKYIANDVLVVKEALEIMFNQGHKKLTIGSCCLSEYKNTYTPHVYESTFPDLTTVYINKDLYKYENADNYIRRSYKGGWCYVVPEKSLVIDGEATNIRHDGVTFDVNSLYPSVMHSESGNRYPVGKPTFWKGNYIPLVAKNESCYYFVRIRTRFYLKEGMLPFIQIKGSWLYPPNECLTSSDVRNPEDGELYPWYIDMDGKEKQAIVELTLTQTDFELLKKHYNLIDFEILDGCYFIAKIGIFDEYINKYKKIKMESKGALRTLAKLFLNNLYGKMASSTNSDFKVAFVKPDQSIGFAVVTANDKKAGYIAVGSAITSYARNFTITAAQMNYHGANRGFCYADTDSIHCDLNYDEVVGIKIHETEFCCWKPESCWDTAVFTRQKTYIEHITHEDLKPVKPYYNVKCAGMPDKSKELFIRTLTPRRSFKSKRLAHSAYKLTDSVTKYSEEEKSFLKQRHSLSDFRPGLVVPGKLLPKRIKGGIVLQDTSYEMRGCTWLM